jgi:hypothetical protein
MAQLARCPRLEALYLRFSQIDSEAIASLREAPKLSTLFIDSESTPVTDADKRRILAEARRALTGVRVTDRAPAWPIESAEGE